MKRVPSIHISENDLTSVLLEVFSREQLAVVRLTDQLKPITAEELSEVLCKCSKTKCLSSRLIVVSNDKLLKKTEKVKLARRDNASLFSQTLLMIRRKYKHRGLELIKPGERYWLELKEICQLATEFCNEFQIPLKQGYKIYCEMGITLMKSYSLIRFKSLTEKIFNNYEAQIEIDTDKYPQKTKEIYDYYLKKVVERVGWISGNFRDDPTKYVSFVRVRQECTQKNIRPKDYIDAQFEGLEWANAVPDPTQLYGPKAQERLLKFCYKNGISTSKKQAPLIDFSKIQKHGKAKNPGR